VHQAVGMCSTASAHSPPLYRRTHAFLYYSHPCAGNLHPPLPPRTHSRMHSSLDHTPNPFKLTSRAPCANPLPPYSHSQGLLTDIDCELRGLGGVVLAHLALPMGHVVQLRGLLTLFPLAYPTPHPVTPTHTSSCVNTNTQH
jgi:hypothetical protein